MPQTPAPVLIVGSMALDSVRTPAGEVQDALGGAADYSSVAASFFAPVQLVGVVGDDFPQEHLDFLASRNIDLGGVQIVPGGKTFRWAGYYDFDLNIAHTLDTQLNVFADFQPTLPANFRQAPYVFLANIDPELQLQVVKQIKHPKLTVCDTMNFWIDGKPDALKEVLKHVDIAFMNDAEARQLTGKLSIIKAAKALQALGPKTVIIKKGEHGALLFSGDDHFAAPSYPLEDIADPTGAGDSFAGGFIGYVASQDDTSLATLRKAVIYGSVMASYNVEDFSLNRLRSLTQNDIKARYQAFKQISHFDALAGAAVSALALLSPVLDLVYPPRCFVCRELGHAGGLCDACLSAVTPVPAPAAIFAVTRSVVIATATTAADAPCLHPRPRLGRLRGVLRDALHRFKYHDRPALAEPLGLHLAAFARTQAIALNHLNFDALIPVPMHPTRRRLRGYNQSERLARVVAHELGLPMQPTWLRRVRSTRPQVGLDADARTGNLHAAFAATDAVAGKTLLLIDDVTTTSSTLHECATALKASGAQAVYALTLAAG